MLINPTEITDHGIGVLRAFLQQNPDFSGVFFSKDQNQVYSCIYEGKSITFKLTHSMIRRTKSKNDGGDVYDEFAVFGDTIGGGNFGIVNDIAGSLSLSRYPEYDFAFKPKTGNSLIKTQQHYIDYPQERSLVEFRLLQTTSHAKAKHYHYDNDSSRSFIVARKAKGMTLLEVIEQDVQRISRLTTEQRLRLSVNILRSVRSQVRDKGIVHRDIKPANIIIDKNFNAAMIDYGLARFADSDDGVICGSIDYIAPEILSINTTKLTQNAVTDVYAAGVTLKELWQNHPINIKTYDFRVRLSLLLADMMRQSPSERISLDEAILRFEAMRLDYCISRVPRKLHDDVYVANQIAGRIQADIARSKLKNSSSYIDIMQRLVSYIVILPDSLYAVREFCLILGLGDEMNIASKQDVLRIFAGIQDAAIIFTQQLESIIAAVLYQKKMDDYLSYSGAEARNRNYDYILMIARHELAKLSRGPDSFLDFLTIHERMKRKIAYLSRLRYATMQLGAWSKDEDLTDMQQKIKSMIADPAIIADEVKLKVLNICRVFIKNMQFRNSLRLYSKKKVPDHVVAYVGRVIAAVCSCTQPEELSKILSTIHPQHQLKYLQLRRLHKDITHAVHVAQPSTIIMRK